MDGGGMDGGMGGGMDGGGMDGGMGGGEAGGMGGGEMAGGPAASSNRQIVTAQQSESADPSNFGGKILKKKTRDRLESEKQKTMTKNQGGAGGAGGSAMGPNRDQKGRVVFTEPEMELMDGIQRYQRDGLLRYRVIPQFPVQYGSQEYPLDFAIPQLKIGLEADGEMFHSNPKQLTHDKERDRKLNQLGWTILRFKDTEIKKKIEQVMQTVLKEVMKKEILLKNMMADQK
jgi:very-short-patch-repair endonuclease